MCRRSSLHILVLGTVLDTGNNFWKLVDGFYTRSPLFSATELIDPASNIVT